jgi:hypothetical protein
VLAENKKRGGVPIARADYGGVGCMSYRCTLRSGDNAA